MLFEWAYPYPFRKLFTLCPVFLCSWSSVNILNILGDDSRDHSFGTYAKCSEKTSIFYPLIRIRTCMYQVVRNVSFSKNVTYVLNEWSHIREIKLIHFTSMFHFCTLRKLQKTFGFLTFSGVIEMKNCIGMKLVNLRH